MISSCSNDDKDSEKVENIILPNKITRINPEISVNNVLTMQYDGRKLIKSSDNFGYVTEYTYEGNYITKEELYIDNKKASIIEYSYLNGKLDFELFKDGGNPSRTKYLYNEDESISFETSLLDKMGNNVIGITLFGKYTYKNGNMIKMESSYSKYYPADIYTYEYDNKNNPYKNILGMNLLVGEREKISTNNVVKMDLSAGTTFINTISCTYDSNGFPIEKKYMDIKSGKVHEIYKFDYN
ncbi:hypothetical protein J2Y38_004130 [Flavobacterium sp. 2755]|uniref:hypothetical protein n=1 Tax=Flavobacterium sp. 2755 TaxID=2817765 RepID=UPI002863315A|nr:hypothetical protein [Flavobacterium sp. 2755]MDR6763906.1 hypothetical protein [Flavobacterium sp. 2755]